MDPDAKILCCWGQLDGQTVDFAGATLDYLQSRYRWRPWCVDGQLAFGVYILAGADPKTKLPYDLHPETASRVKAHQRTLAV